MIKNGFWSSWNYTIFMTLSYFTLKPLNFFLEIYLKVYLIMWKSSFCHCYKFFFCLLEIQFSILFYFIFSVGNRTKDLVHAQQMLWGSLRLLNNKLKGRQIVHKWHINSFSVRNRFWEENFLSFWVHNRTPQLKIYFLLYLLFNKK